MFKKSIWIYSSGVAVLHILGIACLLMAVPHHATLLGLGFLAYTFGLRHAFDADHIAAIDNIVRKLRQEQKNPIGVGFFFSLGHSTVVCVMTGVTAFAVHWVQRSIPALQHIGGIVGTIVSAAFLFVIGIVNLVVLIHLYRVFLKMRQSSFDETQFEELLNARGLIFRFISPLFKIVKQSWNAYPIGFLFGLGFDTASEVSLLAISAGAAKNTTPYLGIIALPILFAAGMSLMDTADGIFMTTAYDWAFVAPIRKIYYNLTVTGLSVTAALFIGLIEAVQAVSPMLGLNQGFWAWLQNVNFGTIGFILVCLFIVAWLVSYGVWKLFRVDQRFS
ncbi:HoxN/HupN/NixA family nickel/cobalt transporter [Alicyclobacillus ferrooxydans]|uniref:Nickel/cobalt efflux system n=1 Tax=Alicyclobacillus ferrooxydans TaxID=471514 RepID=A0A0P9EHQ8_9BACL|nr:HoxN/HupN/NixA family nickel/cobalt transporter [Alicyclobacillus ferrooxydans]KPV42217.1 nickel permease [Alicyclobacillus ferrooxydans]